MKKTKTWETLANNLNALMGATGMTRQALAKQSGVSLRMIAYILKGERIATIEVADMLAHPFGLTGWQLLVPTLPADMSKNGHLAKLVADYSASSAEGREYISRVAEHEAQYKISKP